VRVDVLAFFVDGGRSVAQLSGTDLIYQFRP
jgi:hypothetical protein